GILTNQFDRSCSMMLGCSRWRLGALAAPGDPRRIHRNRSNPPSSRRTPMIRALLVAALAGISASQTRAADPPKRPNILLIYADDQSYTTVGCPREAGRGVKPPNIDARAGSGVRSHGAYLGAWCMPPGASMLPGPQPPAIQSMRMDGPSPASTYDPKQCPFWPALFRKS